jgi:hypothetical protein
MTDPFPLRWMCNSCDWIGNDADLLRAPSPFDSTETICACPKCKAVEDVINACDEPTCDRPATCGFPTATGYRRTCHRHSDWATKLSKEKP